MRLARPLLTLCLAALALPARPGAAPASTFTAQAGSVPSSGSTGPQIAGPVSVFGGVGSTGQVYAYCDELRMACAASVSNPVSGLFTPQITAPCEAMIVIDDMHFIAPPDFEPHSVPMTLHMRLTGDLVQSGPTPYDASIEVRAIAHDFDIIGRLSLGPLAPGGTGPLAGAPYHMVEFPVDFNTINFVGNDRLQSMTLSFIAEAGGTAIGTSVNTASAAFGGAGLHFVTDGPLFDLPDGVTVDIPSLHVVHNHIVDPTAGVAPQTGGGRLALAVRENPSRGPARIALTLPHEGAPRVEVFDVRGRRVATLLDGWSAAGRRDLVWANAGDQPAGVYFVRASSANQAAHTRFVTVR